MEGDEMEDKGEEGNDIKKWEKRVFENEEMKGNKKNKNV
jgi:hypothetical protein